MPIALSRLRKTALKSERLHKHATLIVKGGSILTCQFNNWVEHSEVRALKSIEPVKGLTLINIRIGRSGNIKSSFPCLKCLKTMRDHAVRRVIYSNEAGQFQEFFL